MDENERVVITLEFEDGESVDCEVMGLFEYDEYPDKEFIALVPVDEKSDDVYIYEFHEISEDEFELLDIESDEDFKKITDEFDRLVEESLD